MSRGGTGGLDGVAPSALTQDLGLLSSGQVLAGRYEVGELLGRGGMGEVWRADDLKLRVEVALKALREDLFCNLVFDRAGTRIAGGNYGLELSVVPLDGGAPLGLEGFQEARWVRTSAAPRDGWCAGPAIGPRCSRSG